MELVEVIKGLLGVYEGCGVVGGVVNIVIKVLKFEYFIEGMLLVGNVVYKCVMVDGNY